MIADLLVHVVLKMIPDDAISKIVNGVKSSKSNSLGADLFRFYHLLTKVVDAADSIVADVVDLHRLCNENPNFDYAGCRTALSLRNKIDSQIRNVDICCGLFLDLELSLDLVSTSSYRYISNFLGPKKSYLYALQRPMGPDFGHAEIIAIFLQEDDIEEIGCESDFDEGMRKNYCFEYISDLFEKNKNEILSFARSEGGNLFAFSLARYLEKREPKKQIEEMRSALLVFYNAILSNFEIKDLLPLVNKPHMK